MDIELLLADPDDGHAVLTAGLPLATAARAPRPPTPTVGALRYDSREPNSLALQRWGLIAPHGADGDRLLDLVEPLRRARQQAQGAPVRVYRVRSDMNPIDAARWKSTVYWDERVAEADRPRYLLILGDLDQVPLVLQQALASDVFVGRLALSDDDAYRAYVDKVLRWEQAPAVAPRALFCTARDGTAATEIGYDVLITPAMQACRANRERDPAGLGDVVEVGAGGAGVATPAVGDFLDAVAQPGPAALLSLCHGLGAPRGGWRSTRERRALQGAMSFGDGARLSAEDVAERPFLAGGIWFFVACYGGATPTTSAYYAWMKRLHDLGVMAEGAGAVLAGLPRPGEAPFVAALPQAVLANPEGPLAVMAHADLAWTYSFQDVRIEDGQPALYDRCSRFQAMLRSALDGCRVGAAGHELWRHISEASVELSMIYDQEEWEQSRGGADPAGDPRAVQKASLFLTRNDLAGYILLGDPAARLACAQPVVDQAQEAAGPSPEPSHAQGQDLATRATSVLGVGVAAAPARRSPERMEEAVLALLRGRDAAVVAVDAGVSRAELQRWVEGYREGGRRALARLRDGG
ncbi:hypothetical protein [Haliangium sp.]|uniref:hypothetical protein n=1 Tax=Haliangium sp. TaxID=2663208 RepID=UPI003D151880